MGEFANRKHDNARIKIGTCEDLYYLRWEDRYCVTPQRGDVDPANESGLRFRLPFPDEDDVLPGNYEDYNRGLRLYRTVKDEMGREWTKDYQVSVDADPGSIQFSHPSGLLFSMFVTLLLVPVIYSMLHVQEADRAAGIPGRAET